MLDTDRLIRETFVAGVEHHARIGSTNDRARDQAAEPCIPTPRLIVADRQTAGRGRGTNRWWTGDGALAFSLLVRLDIPPARSPLVALATGVAVTETVRPLLPDHSVGLHWPNDIHVGDRKLSGILVEVLSERLHIIGVGLNTNCSAADAPPQLRSNATTLFDLTNRRHDHTSILLTLLDQLEDALDLLASEPERLAARADSLCLQHGRTLSVTSGDRVLRGVCAGLAPDGALLLDTPNGRQVVHSGVIESPSM